jgi:hypothetical protein
MIKNIASILFVFGFLISQHAICQTSKEKDQKAKIEMLKAFYTEYITENAKQDVDQKQVDAIKKKYCSSKFLNQLTKLQDEIDYDIFLSAQRSTFFGFSTIWDLKMKKR